MDRELDTKNYSHTLDSLVSTDVIQGHVTSSASLLSTGRSIGCIFTSFRLYTFRAFGFVLTVPVLFTLSSSVSDAEDDAPYDDSLFRTTAE